MITVTYVGPGVHGWFHEWLYVWLCYNCVYVWVCETDITAIIIQKQNMPTFHVNCYLMHKKGREGGIGRAEIYHYLQFQLWHMQFLYGGLPKFTKCTGFLLKSFYAV